MKNIWLFRMNQWPLLRWLRQLHLLWTSWTSARIWNASMSKDGTSSSPKLYESMGVPSGISQVGSSRPRNEPTGSSRSPEGKINRDQPTSRGIIPRPQFGGFFVFTQWLFPRHHNIIWAIRKPPFKTSKFSQHSALYVLWPKENINQQSVSPQIKREPSMTVSPQFKRESSTSVSPQIKRKPSMTVSPQFKKESSTSVSPQIKREPSMTVSPQFKRESPSMTVRDRKSVV